jgi:hypothetical protein
MSANNFAVSIKNQTSSHIYYNKNLYISHNNWVEVELDAYISELVDNYKLEVYAGVDLGETFYVDNISLKELSPTDNYNNQAFIDNSKENCKKNLVIYKNIPPIKDLNKIYSKLKTDCDLIGYGDDTVDVGGDLIV